MIIFAHLFGYISCVQNRWAKIIVARQQCCSNQNIMVNPKTLEFFKGDEIAASVWTSKYKFGDEETPNDSFKRYVGEFAATEKRRLDGIENFGLRLNDLSEYGKSVYGKYLKGGAIESDLQAEFLEDVNFNRILLGGSLMQGVGQHHLFSSLSNCLVLGNVHDSYGGISLKTEELAQTMKRRMGAGLNISELRPNGADIHNQATWSSGPILFADRFSYITKEIAQYGRRGALMLNIHINHPDSIAFARHKQDLRNLTGANISIIFDDEFMQAVKRGDETYFQRYPIDLDVADLDPNDFELNKLVAIESPQDFEDTQCFVKLVNPVEEWKNIIQFAWNTGEPGLLFKNSWREMRTDYMYKQYRPVSTNPCSELPMQTYDTCRLCSVNLLSLFDSKSNSLVPDSEIYKIFYNQQRLMDVIVDLDTEYIDRIINKIYTDRTEPDELKTRELAIWFKIKAEALNGRRTGSGFTALGDLFALMNLQYGSEESLKLAEKIFSLKMRAELDATTDLAVLYGAFKGFDPNLEYPNGIGVNKMLRFLKDEYPAEIARMLRFGRRNVSWSTAAPTGSLSMMAQTTSGIEPIFKVFTYRRIKCTKDTDRVDFIDPADGQKFTVYKNIHPQFAFWIERNFNIPVHDTYNKLSEEELQNYFEQSPWYGSESGDIDWLKRVELQSLIQRYTTAAISSTVNLPNDVDVSEVSKIYQAAYERDLKGICVYRDGCRAGVFQTEASSKEPKELKEFVQTRAPKRPERLKAKRYVFTAKGQQNIVYIGLLDSKPFEIFVCEPDRGLTDTPEIEGELIKVGKGHYDFEYKQDEKVINEPDIGRRQINEHYKVSLLLSMALRHGTPLKFVIKTINKTEPLYGTFTIRLVKLLSSFMENGTSTGVKCPECGDDYVFENGCYICKSCGNTKC